MDTKKLHHMIAFVSYPVIILNFLFADYTTEKLISGIVFFSGLTFIYVGIVYLFFKSKSKIG